MNILKKVFAILTALLGIAMIVLAFYFFFYEEDAIVCLASLYVALFISIIITTVGIVCIFSNIK